MSRQEIKDPQPTNFRPQNIFSNKVRDVLEDKHL